MMGRTPREFTFTQVNGMERLFNEGATTQLVGEVYGCSAATVQRVLRKRLGDLRSARVMAKVRRSMAAGRLKDLDYREGFEAGYRMALTHTKLHGLKQTQAYCDRLLPWRDEALDDRPPTFP